MKQFLIPNELNFDNHPLMLSLSNPDRFARGSSLEKKLEKLLDEEKYKRKRRKRTRRRRKTTRRAKGSRCRRRRRRRSRKKRCKGCCYLF